MSKVIIPQDRSHKQPVTCFCMNPECLEDPEQGRFEVPFEHSQVECPKCGANQSPMVGVLALIHFLARDKAGPVTGAGGLRYKLACDSKRAYLATVTNQEAASGDASVVNCPGCLTAIEAQKLAKQQGSHLIAKE